MKKIYILDTSALIFDPNCFTSFTDSTVIIPIAVLDELDSLKKFPNEAGKNARICIRLLDAASNDCDISEGVTLEDNIFLQVDAINYTPLEILGNPKYGDNKILACAAAWKASSADEDFVCLVSNDINMRVKAKSLKIKAQSKEDTKFSSDNLYSGVDTIIDETAGLSLQQSGSLNKSDYDFGLFPNECVLFEDVDHNGIAMGRMSKSKIKILRKTTPWGLSTRNKEQAFAVDLIMDKAIPLVTLIGKAGTGKSIVAIASALELVINRNEYQKLIIYRPIQAVGNDVGFLPGTLEEKLAPWFGAIMDSFEHLFTTKGGGNWKKELEHYQRKGSIEMEAITYIRGRSIPNSIILIDEAQNLNKDDIKTLLTRTGENSKIILTGDIEQIDNNNLDALNNGLTHVIDKFKDSELAGHITFVHGERSELANHAANVL